MPGVTVCFSKAAKFIFNTNLRLLQDYNYVDERTNRQEDIDVEDDRAFHILHVRSVRSDIFQDEFNRSPPRYEVDMDSWEMDGSRLQEGERILTLTMHGIYVRGSGILVRGGQRSFDPTGGP